MLPIDLIPLENALGHTFRDRALLARALTHSSYANESDASGQDPAQINRDNEPLEFLGDAVLNLVTSRVLFDSYPEFSEGKLSKMRAHLVSARHLIHVARRMGLGDYLRLGRGEERSGGRQKSALLVDALEALLAALYLDAGMDGVRGVIVRWILEPELQRITTDPEAAVELSDQKSALQEWLQATGKPQPAYHVVQAEGPDHEKVFTVEVRILSTDGKELVSHADGSTKKKAEQKAAQQALSILKRNNRSD